MSVQNSLAGFLEIILGLLIGRLVFFVLPPFPFSNWLCAKIVLGYGALIVAAGLITTLSRGGWIAAAVAITSLVLWGSWEFRRLWFVLSFALLGGAAGWVLFWNRPRSTYIKVTLSGDSKDKVHFAQGC